MYKQHTLCKQWSIHTNTEFTKYILEDIIQNNLSNPDLFCSRLNRNSRDILHVYYLLFYFIITLFHFHEICLIKNICFHAFYKIFVVWFYLISLSGLHYNIRRVYYTWSSYVKILWRRWKWFTHCYVQWPRDFSRIRYITIWYIQFVAARIENIERFSIRGERLYSPYWKEKDFMTWYDECSFCLSISRLKSIL